MGKPEGRAASKLPAERSAPDPAPRLSDEASPPEGAKASVPVRFRAVALALLLKPGATLHLPQAMTALYGVGQGLANTALLIAVQTSVAWAQRGVATASTMFARTIGGTLAVGILGAMLSAALLSDASIPEGAADHLLGPAHGAGLAADVLRALAASLQGGLSTVFWAIAGISVAAAATTVLFPHIPVTKPEPGAAAIVQPEA